MVPFRAHLARGERIRTLSNLQQRGRPGFRTSDVLNFVASFVELQTNLAILSMKVTTNGTSTRSFSLMKPRQFLLLSLLALLSGSAHGVELSPASLGWLQAQSNLSTWSAEVIQTRTLKTLAQPLVTTGRVWFAAPNRFRWEIGTPPQTIALRQPDQLTIIYPKLKRAERYPLTGPGAGPWKDTLALLEAGFPRGRAELESRFRILSDSLSNEVRCVTLQPRSAAARRMMPEIKIFFSPHDSSLRATELQFTDGSTLRNDFHHPALNPQLEEPLFNPDLGPDCTLVEPFKKP